MNHILLVEDSVDVQELVSRWLSPIAEVTKVSSVAGALQVCKDKHFDLILMDVMLDDGDGFALTSQLREKSFGKEVPVIFLTSKGDIADKAMGFRLGAEDYIVKPFDPAELKLRVENRLQKASEKKGGQDLVRGNLRLNIALQKAYLISENKNLDLTPLQFKLLFSLLNQEPEIVTREQLIDAIWGVGVQIGRSIDTHINSLRKKLGPYAGHIQTVYGQGYRFLSDTNAKSPEQSAHINSLSLGAGSSNAEL